MFIRNMMEIFMYVKMFIRNTKDRHEDARRCTKMHEDDYGRRLYTLTVNCTHKNKKSIMTNARLLQFLMTH